MAKAAMMPTASTPIVISAKPIRSTGLVKATSRWPSFSRANGAPSIVATIKATTAPKTTKYPKFIS